MNASVSVPCDASRCVIDGVPRLAFEPKPELNNEVELCPFPSALRACLRATGDDVPYDVLMGCSGAAFRLSWKEGWHGDNPDIMYLAADPMQPYARAFDACGRSFESLGLCAGSVPEPELRTRILRAIREERRPLIGFGLVGPPEACVIAGYDAGGDVLIGRSFFEHMPDFSQGVAFEPNGYFRKKDWYASLEGIMTLGPAGAKPEPRELYRKALAWAVTVARTPSVSDPDNPNLSEAWRNRHSGLAAYEAWARHMRDDNAFAGDTEAQRQRYMVFNDAVSVVAEGRWYASMFLARVAAVESRRASTFYTAASCYAREHELMWEIWAKAGGPEATDANLRTMASPGTRQAIADLILQARDFDARAAELLAASRQ